MEAWMGGDDEASEVRACMATMANARTEARMGERATRIFFSLRKRVVPGSPWVFRVEMSRSEMKSFWKNENDRDVCLRKKEGGRKGAFASKNIISFDDKTNATVGTCVRGVGVTAEMIHVAGSDWTDWPFLHFVPLSHPHFQPSFLLCSGYPLQERKGRPTETPSRQKTTFFNGANSTEHYPIHGLTKWRKDSAKCLTTSRHGRKWQ